MITKRLPIRVNGIKPFVLTSLVASIMASSFHAHAVSRLVPHELIDHSEDIAIDNKSKIGLATEVYLKDYSDSPTPGIVTGEIFSIQGNLAVGSQTINFTLNSNSTQPYIVNDVLVSPGQTITMVVTIPEDGRLRIPFKATSTQDGKFDYTIIIPELVSINDKVPDLSVYDASILEGNSGHKSVEVEIAIDVKYGRPVSFNYITKDIDTASISGEARNLAYDHYNNPFISIVDNPNGGRLVLDGGFPKHYNGTNGVGDTWLYMRNVWNWIKTEHFGNGVLLLGDKPASHGGSYRVKDCSSSGGFCSSFTKWAQNNGIALTIKDVDNYGGFGNANISLAELKRYQAVIVMGSETSSSNAFTQSTIAAFGDYSKSGGGIMLITDHDAFQGSVNQIAANFNLRFWGNVNRAPVLVSDLIARYGDHPLWDGLTVVPAGGSEGNVDINAVDFSQIDYEGVGGKVTLAPGEKSIKIPIKIYGDTIKEQNERFSVNVENVVNANPIDTQGIVTILNDD